MWRTRLLACYLAAICHDYEHRCVFGTDPMLNAGASCDFLLASVVAAKRHFARCSALFSG